jgi:tRNA G18 (ribose-2'-O)-methylase SpoU
LNVINQYKEWTVAKIKEDLERKSFPYAVMMQHINGDFNISTFIRNGNAFGAREIFYWGKKKWDRRGAVGSHNYKQLTHLSSFEDIQSLKKGRRFIAIDNNIERDSKKLNDFTPMENDIYVFGEESCGIQKEVLDICDEFVYIPQWGSVRSVNVGTASGIIMQYVSSKMS